MTGDLTRWNRAGLSRIEYLDGNAAVFLERMRAGLNTRFPGWHQVQCTIPPDETEEARKARLEALYAASPDDILWQITRQFARACHVLGGHIEAYANESYLGTATQWENLRRLVALLDYAPRPHASAIAPLALLLKDGMAGTMGAGLQVQNTPKAGTPVVFETLADLEVDAAFNILYAREHLRNPAPLSGTTLVLEQRLDKMKSGEPLVLENERTGQLSAHTVLGIVLGDSSTKVVVSPAIPAGFVKGYTLVHVSPKEKLAALAPATKGVETVGHGLQLAGSSSDLAAGDLVVIRSADDKPYFRRIKAAHKDSLVFYHDVGQLTLDGATVARAVTLPLANLASPPKRRSIQADKTVVDVVYAAGDWSRLANQWLADIRKVTAKESGRDVQREYLPAYRCLHAKYVPVSTNPAAVASDERPGYTTLTLTWNPDTDGVPGNLDFKLNNPQTLLVPPEAPGGWAVDTFLNKSEDGRVVRALVTGQCKQMVAGDLAVIVKGRQLAWARLGAVAPDMERGEATLSAQPYWQDRGGGPYFLSQTRVYGHFSQAARVAHWQNNRTRLSGVRVAVENVPPGLRVGRAVILDNGRGQLATTLADVSPSENWLELADPLPNHTYADTLKIYANVVSAGHGEARPQRVLGSGDGTLGNQRFTLAVSDLSFVADAAMSAGVRAAVEVAVAGEIWKQVANLKDSAPTDAHYQVRIDQASNAAIQFGDGRHGRRLPSGANNIRVTFRQGAGVAGNLAAGSLIKLVKPHPLVNAVLQPIASSGGADREANADLRTHAPATLLALDRAVSLEDFSQLARGHASVWQACAFRKEPGLGRRERIEVVVMAAGGGHLSDALKRDVTSHLQMRAQPGVAIDVTDYVRLTFRLNVTVRVRSEAFHAKDVKDAVLAALVAAFSERQRQLGQTLYRGEIYRIIEGVVGVENSDCDIVLYPSVAAQLAKVAKVGDSILAAQPGPSQCLVFDSSGFNAVVQEFNP